MVELMNETTELPAELALIGRIVDRLGPRVRSIGGSIRWVVDGASFHLDLDVDGGRWRHDEEKSLVADAVVEGTSGGVRALFGSADELRRARLNGEVFATGDLSRLAKIGVALREGGSIITQRARKRDAR
jgi:hypothetical protein